MPSRRVALAACLAPLLPFLPGCSALAALDAVVPRDTYRAQEGIAYGAEARQRLDIYLPLQPQGALPLVVFFYGGSWTRGARSDYRFVGEALASGGAAVAVADYRLSPQVRWRDILADCALAVRWARENAARFGCDPGRLLAMGHSAGAYNAAMLALDPRWLGAHGLAPGELAGWIGLAGPYDFLPISDADARVAFDWPDTPADSQPIVHAGPAAPRTLLVAAARDPVVSTERSSIGLARRLQAAGVPVRLHVHEELNHATVVGALAPPLRGRAPVREEVLAFVRTARSGRS